MPDEFLIRTVSPWRIELRVGDAYFSPEIPSERADALLCNWAPSEELFSFPRRKAWYCCEPHCQFRGLGGGSWPTIRDRLAPSEFLWHNHPDPRYRVPHVTHFEELTVNENPDRFDRAIAIVSNHGGNPWKRHPDLTYRNRIITQPGVDLYGREGWNRYRASRLSLRTAPPENYRGPLPGDWPAAEKRELMAKYRYAVCLENMNEPNYFSEKFVEAVCAGCVPIYRVHPTVRDTVLEGARWIDPNEFSEQTWKTNDDQYETICSDMRTANQIWLTSNGLASSHHIGVFERIGAILAGLENPAH